MVEFWRDETVEQSWRILEKLNKMADFVVIGGWGVYLWTRKLKSRDIDIYIDQENFYKLQARALKDGIAIKRNPRLKKFEIVLEGTEVDIYTPFMCGLAIPCVDVFRSGMISNVEGFRVVAPEPLLLLKAQAARERWGSEKGMKDRVDIISMLAFVDLKYPVLNDLLKKHDAEKSLRKTIVRTLRDSRAEYRAIGLRYEKEGVKLARAVEKNLAV